MDLKNRLQLDMRNAIRAKDDLRKRVLRMALAEVKLAEVETGQELDDAAVISVLQKELKSRRETIEDAARSERPELAATAEAEAEVLQVYMPQPLTPDELEALARQAIAEAGADSPRQMGMVMKILIPRLQGRATGNEASQIVRKLLG